MSPRVAIAVGRGAFYECGWHPRGSEVAGAARVRALGRLAATRGDSTSWIRPAARCGASRARTRSTLPGRPTAPGSPTAPMRRATVSPASRSPPCPPGPADREPGGVALPPSLVAERPADGIRFGSRRRSRPRADSGWRPPAADDAATHTSARPRLRVPESVPASNARGGHVAASPSLALR